MRTPKLVILFSLCVMSNSNAQQNINELLVNLSDSVEDTKKYKTEVAALGENLSKLNTVYGNMLSAMTIAGGQA